MSSNSNVLVIVGLVIVGCQYCEFKCNWHMIEHKEHIEMKWRILRGYTSVHTLEMNLDTYQINNAHEQRSMPCHHN